MSYSKMLLRISKRTVKLSEKDDASLNKLVSIMRAENNTKKCKHHSNEYYLLTKVLKQNDFKDELFRIMTLNFDIPYRVNHNKLKTFNPHQGNYGLVLKLIRALCSMHDIIFCIENKFLISSLSSYKSAVYNDIKNYGENFYNDLNELFLYNNHINGKCLSKDKVNLLVCGFVNKISNRTNYNQDIENEIVNSVGFCNVNSM